MGLPVPPGMVAEGSTPTRKAKIQHDELPVGGAPPVDAPAFKDAPKRAMPQHVEEAQLPANHQKRSPEEVKADFEKAAAIMSRGQVTSTGTPDRAVSLQDTPVAAQAAVAQPETPQPDPSEPLPDAIESDDDGPTFGDMRSTGSFAWEEYHAAMQEKSDFRRPEIRRAIEGRSGDIDVEDLILYESVSQRQIIIPGKLEPVFRTLTTAEDLAMKDWVYALKGSDRYILDTLTAMTITMGLKSFNDADLPDHRAPNEAGEMVPDEELFQKKMKIVTALGASIVGILSVSYKWFDERVRKTLVTGVLGKS